MKKYIYNSALVAALAVAAFAFSASSANASAYVAWNNASNDCPTTMIVNANGSGTTTGGNYCGPTSLSVNPGDTVNVRIYAHNTGTAAAGNTVVTLNQPSASAQSSFVFNGTVMGGQATASGQAVLSLPSAQTLTLSNVAVQKYGQPATFVSNASAIFTGLSIGQVDPQSTCSSVNYCNLEYIIVSFKVSNNGSTTNTNTNTNTGTPCAINSFRATPTTVTSGTASELSWSTTTGCTSVSIAGGRISNNYPTTGQVSTGALTSPVTTYVLTAAGNGASHSASAVVNTTAGSTGTTCAITSFSPSPTSVTSGSSSVLNWTTNSGCSTVTLSGGTVSGTYGANSSVGTGALTSPMTYTLTGVSASGQTSTAWQTTVGVTSVGSTCSTPTIYASPSQVTSGGSTTLYWNASGCASATVTGPNFNQSGLSGAQSVGPIYGSSTYTITAYASNGSSQSASTTVTTSYYNQSGSAPTATTLAAQIGSEGTSATLNGYINSNSGCSYSYSCGSTSYYFQYGTTQYALYSQTPTQTTSLSSGNVSAYVSNLQVNTTYYFQIIATNNYGTTYGGILSFVTNGYGSNSAITAITTIPTNVTASSARLNGLVTGSASNNYYYSNSGSVYFEYGTSPSLGLRTSAQTASVGSSSNYFDTISTSPNTTYYYRIDAVVNGQTYMGSTVAFSTPNYTNNIVTNTNTTTTISRIGTGGGSAFLQLSITDQSQSIIPGDSLNYVVTYQNISGVTLSNVVINVILPTGVTFRQSSQGVLTTNNTVAATIGTLLPVASGTITIQAITSPTIVAGNNFVTTATAAFTLPSNAQDSAVAYVLNNVINQNNLAGLALFGYGFFPTTFLGWILLLGLLLLIILLARYFYHRANAQRVVAAPVTHVHYDTPASPAMHGYNGDNLPH